MGTPWLSLWEPLEPQVRLELCHTAHLKHESYGMDLQETEL